MFAGSPYLAWARRLFGQVDFDLASSGVPSVALAEAGVAFDPTDADDPAGAARYVSAVARYNAVSESEVVPALGTSHAIFLAYAALTSPGDAVLVETPGYDPLFHAAAGLGVTVHRFQRRAEDGFAVDTDAVAARMTPRTRAIVVSNLHNPSGVALSADVVRTLARIAEARGAYVIVDEVYAPLASLPRDGVFRASARNVAPNVIALGSLTKVYGLSALRAGWMLGPEDIVSGGRRALLDTLGVLPCAHGSLGARAFDAIPRLATRAEAIAAGKANLAVAFAREHGLHFSAPAPSLFGLVTVPGAGDLLPAIEALAADRRVLVSAGTFFGASSSFRLSWASLDRERFAEGLSRLAALVTERVPRSASSAT